jgi:hypothetical protein
LTDVTLATVELAAGVEPTSFVCALAAAGISKRAKAAAAEGRSDLNMKHLQLRVCPANTQDIGMALKYCAMIAM